ncbi:glycosyltransferase [Candidatus Peregrinibacteria bacterium]|nr:glycosyltransferase [Candidatus Peregrinibacteria bacterium]
MGKKITAVIINYNTKHLLDSCLESLFNQTIAGDIKIIIIDNDSSDDSCNYVQNKYPEITSICNKTNIGYAPAGNQGINMAKTEYVMLLNPDIKFENDYMEQCLQKMDEDKKIAAIGGKIMKYDFINDSYTNTIDTVGIFCYRNRRFIDDGQGLKDEGQFENEHEVFGISGACPIYRVSALEDIKIMDEYLDEDFFMYKEDVDISWRLRLRGWKCYYYPKAVAHHGRGTGVTMRYTHFEVAKNRGKLNKFQKHYSFKNQRLMQIKNEFAQGLIHDFIHIFWKELLIRIYIIFKEPYLIKSIFKMYGQIPSALRKRRIIMKNRKVGWKEMKKWLSCKQSNYIKW